MAESSTALQKKNAEVPSSRRMMKSPISLDGNRCGPCTASVNSMTCRAGTANRSVGFSPRASRSARCARRQMPAGARIARRLARHSLQLARQLQILRRAVAGVGQAVRLQLREQGAVKIAALRLGIRGRRAADIRPLVPIQTQPAHVRHQLVAKTQLAALDIGVLDAQNEASAALAGPKMAEKGRPRVAQVQGPGGAGRKPRDDGRRIGLTDISQDCTYSSRISEHETTTTHPRIDFRACPDVELRGRNAGRPQARAKPAAAAHVAAGPSGHVDGKLHDRTERRAGAADGGEFFEICRSGSLHRHDFSSRGRQLRHSRRRLRHRLQAQARPVQGGQRIGQWLDQCARHRGHGARPEPHGGDAQFYVNLYDNEALDPKRRAGVTRFSARWFRAWTWSTRSVMSRRARAALQGRSPMQAGRDHENRARCRPSAPAPT